MPARDSAIARSTTRRARWPLLLALWTLFLAGSRATGLVSFPLANYLQSFAILIMLYLPLGILAGWLLAEIVRGPLRSVADGRNGIVGDTAGVFPTGSYRSSNYFVDLVVR